MYQTWGSPTLINLTNLTRVARYRRYRATSFISSRHGGRSRTAAEPSPTAVGRPRLRGHPTRSGGPGDATGHRLPVREAAARPPHRHESGRGASGNGSAENAPGVNIDHDHTPHRPAQRGPPGERPGEPPQDPPDRAGTPRDARPRRCEDGPADRPRVRNRTDIADRTRETSAANSPPAPCRAGRTTAQRSGCEAPDSTADALRGPRPRGDTTPRENAQFS